VLLTPSTTVPSLFGLLTVTLAIAFERAHHERRPLAILRPSNRTYFKFAEFLSPEEATA
jgi:hypothetical protein